MGRDVGGWLERVGDGGMDRRVAGKKRKMRGWRDFIEWLERFRDGEMEGCRRVAGESEGWRVIGRWLESVWA